MTGPAVWARNCIAPDPLRTVGAEVRLLDEGPGQSLGSERALTRICFGALVGRRKVREPISLRVAVGAGVRQFRLKHELTQEQLADAMHAHGKRWNRAKVASLEAGAIPVTVEMLVLLLIVLADLSDDWVSFEHLLPAAEQPVELTPAVAIYPGTLVSVLADDGAWPAQDGVVRTAAPIDGMWSTVAYRSARVLGCSRREVDEAACAIWGHPIINERDRQVAEKFPDGSNAQQRGRITRQLTAEISAYLETH